MKYVLVSPGKVVTVSDAAMDRARRAFSKVTCSPDHMRQINQAAQALPDVAIMAGAKRLTSANQLGKTDVVAS